MASIKGKFSETESFIKLWQAEESISNIFSRSSHFQMFLTIDVLKKSKYLQENVCLGVYFLKKLLVCRCSPLSNFFDGTPPLVACDYRTNIRSRKKSEKLSEEYQKEKIFFMYKYLSVALGRSFPRLF